MLTVKHGENLRNTRSTKYLAGLILAESIGYEWLMHFCFCSVSVFMDAPCPTVLYSASKLLPVPRTNLVWLALFS